MKYLSQLSMIILLQFVAGTLDAQDITDVNKKLIITSNTINSGFSARPDSSVNFEAIYKHFQKHPERWKIAFKFLSELDKITLRKGRTNLSTDVYYTYNEYTTKDLEKVNYESHKQYIDIQYLIEGEEYIGHTNDNSLPVIKPYNEKKDITFYDYDGRNLLHATPERYFIFFPEDIHKPSIKVKDNTLVKKIVVKIKMD